MARKKTSNNTADSKTLANAARALAQAAQALAASTERFAQVIQTRQDPRSNGTQDQAEGVTMSQPNNSGPNVPSPKAPPSPPDEEARRFIERLEQAGQLADVDEHTDQSKLPSRITHVRRPDGSVHRIGFSASPYASDQG